MVSFPGVVSLGCCISSVRYVPAGLVEPFGCQQAGELPGL